jgi:dGTPase
MNWEKLLSSARRGQQNLTGESSRSAFEQDYDRIIFSHPFRRLQDKTQVHPLPEHDFVHTRLTHSLEVSSVARTLGRKAGEVIVERHENLKTKYSLFDFGAIAAAAALAHDLGNPPFGHAGEDALGDFFTLNPYGQSFKDRVSEEEWVDLTKFEGNAQGFRILTTSAYGLKLTNATLGAFTKYPCSASTKNRSKERKSQKKFGFYRTESATFAEIAGELGLIDFNGETWARHPLAFLVEAADDICYSIIDLEDACRLGLVTFPETVDFLAAILGDAFKREKMDRISGQNEKVAVLRAMAIGKLVSECTDVFLQHEGLILDGDFDRALTDLCPSREILTEISRTSVDKIYRAKHVVEIEATGHVVLPGLLEEFCKAGEFLFMQKEHSNPIPRKYKNMGLLFPAETRAAIEQSTSNYGMLRICLDFVSGLTDKHAVSLYRKVKGITF